MKLHNLKFAFSPKLIILLGRQLIHDKKIALSELVKNAYDADASEVKIVVTDNEITVLDDGDGMDLHTIENVWLKPGVSGRKDKDGRKDITKKGRLPTGEKGVGRLSAHYLGSKITLFSKKSNSTGVFFEIDWDVVEDANSLDDLDPIEVKEDDEKIELLGGYKKGTYIKIEGLRETWQKKEFTAVERDLSGLIAPSSKEKNFNIYFGEGGSSKNLEDRAKKIRDNALYHFNVVFENGVIQEFVYKFCPWDSLSKIPAREVTHINDREELEKKMSNIKNLSLDMSKEKKADSDGVGKVCFEGYIYDFDAKLLREEFGSAQEGKSIKEYMKSSGGVRVYRDNFRVFNYGERGFDILELDLERLNNPSKKTSSNQIAASVLLNGMDSNELIEKTNREGFMHNQAFEQLQESLGSVMHIINLLRQEDKAEIIKIYIDKIDKADIETKMNRLREVIDKSVPDEEKKKKIFSQFDAFSAEFSHLKKVLLTASNTGLNLVFIVHELDKVVGHLGNALEAENYTLADEIFNHLYDVLDSYKNTVRLDKRMSSFPLHEMVSQAILNFNYRFENHRVKIVQELDNKLNITCQKGLIIGLINNLFDNAVYWLNTYKISNKKILIRLYQEENFVCLLIADNGKGFNITFESALAPFISGRSDETSMGIGLYLAEQIMISHQGFIEMGSAKEDDLPKEFAKGAIIKLKFKRGK